MNKRLDIFWTNPKRDCNGMPISLLVYGEDTRPANEKTRHGQGRKQ